MPFQTVTWATGNPVQLEKLAKMQQNDTFMKDALEEKPQGIIFNKNLYNNITVAKQWKTIISGFVSVKPDRYYYIGFHLGQCENDSTGYTAFRILVDGVQRSYFLINNTGAGASNNDDGGLHLFHIYKAPSNVLINPNKSNENIQIFRKKIQFAVKANASTGNTTVHGTVGNGPSWLWVEDYGAVLRTETAI